MLHLTLHTVPKSTSAKSSISNYYPADNQGNLVYHTETATNHQTKNNTRFERICSMYIYYVLRGTQGEIPTEYEGDLSEELFPAVDLSDGPSLVQHIVQKLQTEGSVAEWSDCDLTDSFFDREDNYIYFNNRWMRRSDAPWRKDRNN